MSVLDRFFPRPEPRPGVRAVTQTHRVPQIGFRVDEDKKIAMEHCGNWEPHLNHEWRSKTCPDWLLKCGGELD